MAKKSKNRFLLLLEIFWEGITIYCKYLDTFLKYMFFPVIGQLVGFLLIFGANYFFIVNLPELIQKYPLLDNISLVFTLLLICVFPGFLIFSKAFYDYIVAMSSLNSMVYVSRGEKMKGKPLDTKTHDDILKKRIGKYILLLLILSIITTIGLFPLFIVPFGVLCVYLCLTFQVFMLEESVSPIKAIQRSFYLVKTNFLMTFALLAMSFGITYFLIPQLFLFGAEKMNILQYLAYPIQKYLDILPVNDLFITVWQTVTGSVAKLPEFASTQINSIQPQNITIGTFINTSNFAKGIVSAAICGCVTAFLLPMRSAWFTLLYKTFDFEKTEELRKQESKKAK